MRFINLDTWNEIFAVLLKNKLRTILTGLSVSWGIFMFIILLGSGNGLQNGVQSMFNTASHRLVVSAGKTTKAYNGFKEGREIKLNYNDVIVLKEEFAAINVICPAINMWFGNSLTYQKEMISCNMTGVFPERKIMSNFYITKGRNLNVNDIIETRKVIIINEYARKLLFKDSSAIGKYVLSGNMPLMVVGVFDSDNDWDKRNAWVYIPITLAQQIYNMGENVHFIDLNLHDISVAESKILEEKIRKRLSILHQFHPDDVSAINIQNIYEDFKKMMSLFYGIRIFILIIGLGTIIAGIVGVSNIMMISVKERTKEFGIHRAIGATPKDIISRVLMESLILTISAGYLGLLFGIAILEFVKSIIPSDSFFKNPEVDMQIALFSLATLVISGLIAGYIPAKRAASIKPIEALRDE